MSPPSMRRRRARPPDADLHARRRRGRDLARRRLARLQARLPDRCVRHRRRAQLGARRRSRRRRPGRLREPLTRIQNELFDVGADLSVPWGVTDRLRVEQAMIDGLEELCDGFNADLPELRSFVLPGGTEAAARLHVARTICRRAERDVLLGAQEVELNPLVLALPEPALRPALHPRPHGERRRRRATSRCGSLGARAYALRPRLVRRRVRAARCSGSCSGRCGCR